MTVFSWGSNSHGQLGLGTDTEQVLYPTQVQYSEIPNFIAGGGKHTVLLTCDGEIFTCGDNDKGQLGKELSIKQLNTFYKFNFPLKIQKVSCGWDFNLALNENCELIVWGSNLFGQLGLATNKVKYLSIPQIVLKEQIIDIAAGLRHSAVITVNKLLLTSGFGRKGQLGVLNNKSIPSSVDKFTLVEGINDCERISCGENHCIVQTSKNCFYSWGSNKYGQLGLDPVLVSFSAVPVETLILSENLKPSCLLSGWSHNLILTEDGQVMSWGRNNFGQLGHQKEPFWKPQIIENLGKVKQICLGSHHSVLLKENKEVLTWGWNEHGNCGNKNVNNVLTPYRLEGFHNVVLIGSGAAHSFLWV